MNCSNCGTKLSCGCQQKVATDGKTVCTHCVTNYESSIRPHLTNENQQYIWDIPHNYYPKK
jgi:hypothetical protein